MQVFPSHGIVTILVNQFGRAVSTFSPNTTAPCTVCCIFLFKCKTKAIVGYNDILLLSTASFNKRELLRLTVDGYLMYYKFLKTPKKYIIIETSEAICLKSEVALIT